MNVKALIKELEFYPSDATVIVSSKDRSKKDYTEEFKVVYSEDNVIEFKPSF